MLGEEGLARALVRHCRDDALQEILLEGRLEMVMPSDETGRVDSGDLPVEIDGAVQ